MWFTYIMEHSSTFKNEIMKYTGKLMKLEKNLFKCSVPDPETQIWYRILAVKSMINKLQFI